MHYVSKREYNSRNHLPASNWFQIYFEKQLAAYKFPAVMRDVQ